MTLDYFIGVFVAIFLNLMFFEYFIYRKKIKKLKTTIKKLEETIAINEKNKNSFKVSKNNINASVMSTKQDILENPNKYYYVKQNIFNDKEQNVYFKVNEFLKKVNKNYNHSKFEVLIKVRLADFINLTKFSNTLKIKFKPKNDDDKISKEMYDNILSSITSKHIDLLICFIDRTKTKYNDYNNPKYIPIIGIEVDGKSHNSGDYIQQQNDEFKTKVLNSIININFMRIDVRDDSKANYNINNTLDVIDTMVKEYI